MVDTPSSYSTSPSLIVQVKGDDPDAWRRLAYIYTPLVYGWIRKAGISEEDASDLVQEVFVRVSTAIDRFEHNSFRGWLLTITQNEIRGWYRQQKKNVADAAGGSVALENIQNAPQMDESSIDEIGDDEADSLGLVRRAAETIEGDFEKKTWQAFWRSTVDGHDTSAIASDLSMTPQAIRQAKFRVLKRLRETLGDDFLTL